MSNSSSPRPLADPNVYYGQPIIPVVVLCLLLTTTFVALRFWSRGVILRALGIEDAFLLVAWLLGVGLDISHLINLRYGLGRQYAALDDETRVLNLKVSFAITLLYYSALFSVKIGVLCLYIRVLTYPYVRLAAKVMVGVVTISSAWIIATSITACVPVDALWDMSKRMTARCHSGDVWWSHSGLNITTDFLISILPLTVLHKLHVPRRQKIALYLVFLLGFCVCIISLLRTLQFIRVRFIDVERDITPDGVIISVWTMLEVAIAITVACIPTLKPVISRIFPRFLASTPRGSDDTDPWSGTIEDGGRGRRYRRCGEDTIDLDLSTMRCKASDQDSTEPGSRRGRP